MAMPLPRILLMARSFLVRSSSPCHVIDPSTWAFESSSPMIDMEVTDLPEPDSPTIPSVLPRYRSKFMPRTARTVPASEAKETLRSRTLSTGASPS